MLYTFFSSVILRNLLSLTMKENATTAVKVLYHIVVDELYTCYFFMKDNADAYLPPIAIFTTASLLHRGASSEVILPSLTCMVFEYDCKDPY